MRIVKIEDGYTDTYDIEVPVVHEYLLSNGVVSHNTSADLSGSTSGLDLPRDLMTTKMSKAGPVPQIVPNFSKGSSYYTLASETNGNLDYLSMISKFQLYTDQSISTNLYWSATDFDENGRFPIKKLVKAIIHANKIGLKTLYYSNFLTSEEIDSDSGCSGGGCSV